MTMFEVYLDDELFDTVYFNNTMTSEEVRKALIAHDGLPETITVKKVRMSFVD